jgi:hypothetical protein
MNDDNTPLSPTEKQELTECEDTFLRYAQSPFEAGRDLQRIRDDKLYRELSSSFEDYCSEELDCSRSQPDRLIGDWRVYNIFTSIGVVLRNESQARALIRLTDEEILATGKLLLSEIAAGKKLTAKLVRLAKRGLQSAAPSQQPRPKTSSSSHKATEKAMAWIKKAKEALKHDEIEVALEALGSARTCLIEITTDPTANEVSPAATADTASPFEPGAGAALASKPDPIDQIPIVEVLAPIAPEESGQSNIIPLPLLHSQVDVEQPAISHRATTSSKKGFPKPAAILVGATGAPINCWYEALIFVANLLLSQGQPLPSIACIKRKSSEFPASARIKQLRDDWLIDVGDGQDKLLKNARLLLDKSGHGDLPISVQLTNGHTLAV